jgi:hypothetical protein
VDMYEERNLCEDAVRISIHPHLNPSWEDHSKFFRNQKGSVLS